MEEVRVHALPQPAWHRKTLHLCSGSENSLGGMAPASQVALFRKAQRLPSQLEPLRVWWDGDMS